MNRIDDITIERYLSGEMSASEQAEFQALMANDSSLKRRVQTEESMMRALKADRDAARRDHADVRAKVLGSIPRIAPSGGVPRSSGPSPSFNPRWPIIGLVLLVASWVALDVIALDEPARVSRQNTTPAVAPQAAPVAPRTSVAPDAPGTIVSPVATEPRARAVDAAAAPSDAPRVTTTDATPARVRATPRPAATRNGEMSVRPSTDAPATASEPEQKELPVVTDPVAKGTAEIGK